MRFVFDDGTSDHDVDVVIHDPDAVVDDLAAALRGTATPRGAPRLFVDGRPVPGRRRLDRSGLVAGSTVTFEERARADAGTGEYAAVVEVVGGLDAGRSVVLSAGRWTVGRRGTALVVDDPAVSAEELRLDVDADGTVVMSALGASAPEPVPLSPGTVVPVGSAQLTVRPATASDRPPPVGEDRRVGLTGQVSFNRPPRPIATVVHEPLEPPPAPPPVAAATAIGITPVLLPVVLGLAMVWLFGSWMYAMFALLGPAMLAGGAVESRRRARTATRRDLRQRRRDLAELDAALSGVVAGERAWREQQLPTAAELVRRAVLLDGRLWERRPGHGDFLRLRAGLGTVVWAPPLRSERRTVGPEVRAMLDAASRLPSTPVEIDLSGGRVVGITGPGDAARALARSLVVQAAVAHGPADLSVAVLTAPDRWPAWDWAKWLPHAADPEQPDHGLLAADPEHADAILRGLLERSPGVTRPAGGEPAVAGPTTLVVVDDEALTGGRRSPGRSVLRGMAGPVAGIVVAASEDRLPSLCTTVVELRDATGRAVIRDPGTGRRVDDVTVAGMSVTVARAAARAMAGLEDPEAGAGSSGIPASVALLPLLALDPPTPDAVARRWRDAGADPALVVPIGTGEDGVVAVDLVRDGPHALVAGTTGAGKSELLRTLVAGLAAACPPTHLNLVLIDFKGGSAFDRCAALPHTVGMVTDLDEHLAARALRCLDAELRHRERVLREAGAEDLTEHRRTAAAPLPRLVVVIDEFATLAAELPHFVDALVGVAQRGRSLGVHLVLATQRPSGAVSAGIRANANLRIALRVQDPGDSTDVIDHPGAAAISRRQPGRALARLGPGELVAVQTALSTGVAASGGRPPVELHPFAPHRALRPLPAAAPPPGGATDLARLVDATVAASAATGSAPRRRPWPDPLPVDIALDDVVAVAGGRGPLGRAGVVVPFALADLPDEQEQRPAGWSPDDGNLLLVGIGGSGTTTALGSIALALTADNGPDDLHLYVLDLGAGGLVPLAGLPHTGAVVGPDDRERQQRLIRQLGGEVARRQATPGAVDRAPRIVLLLDGLAGFRAVWDEVDPFRVFDGLVRVFADGPEVGVHTAIAADRPGAVPAALAGLTGQRWVFRLGDPAEYGSFGIAPRDVPPLAPGGAVVAGTATHVQVGRPTPTLDEAVRRVAADRSRPRRRPPAPVGRLPTQVDVAEVAGTADLSPDRWHLPCGIGEHDLQPVGLELFEGQHAVVAGPPRSGRTSALCTLARVARRASGAPTIVAVAGHASVLAACPEVDVHLAARPDPRSIDAVAELAGPVLVLVDDAERVPDDHGGLAALVERRRPGLHVVVSGRADALRSAYGHWTAGTRAARTGMLLDPDVDLDGDLLGARLPRRAPVAFGPGRGYLVVDGNVTSVVQLAIAQLT